MAGVEKAPNVGSLAYKIKGLIKAAEDLGNDLRRLVGAGVNLGNETLDYIIKELIGKESKAVGKNVDKKDQ